MKYTIAFILNILIGTSLLIANSPLDPRETEFKDPLEEGNKEDKNNL